MLEARQITHYMKNNDLNEINTAVFPLYGKAHDAVCKAKISAGLPIGFNEGDNLAMGSLEALARSANTLQYVNALILVPDNLEAEYRQILEQQVGLFLRVYLMDVHIDD